MLLKIVFFTESIILFLAAGDNEGDDPLDVIKSENEARNNSVTILTYSFGQGSFLILLINIYMQFKWQV